MESPVQTRRGLDILAISTDSRLNRDALFSSTLGKKRRHDAHAMEDLLKPPIIVKVRKFLRQAQSQRRPGMHLLTSFPF